MKQKLLLTSKGIQDFLKPVFFSLLSKPVSQIRVSYITTAAFGSDGAPEFISYHKNLLQECGIEHIEEFDLRGKTYADLEKHYQDKDVIYVKGGNTFFLLDWMKKSGFDRIIRKLLERGIVYVGVSAGTYVACPTIEQATWKHPERNTIGLTDLTAFNLVPFLATVHFEEKYREVVSSVAQRTHRSIVALTDLQALLVKDNVVTLIGEGKKEFFNGFTEGTF